MQVQDLETKGYVPFTYDTALRSQVRSVAKTFEEFTRLPDEQKELFQYQRDGRLSGVGYENKRYGEGDSKENMHLSRAGGLFLKAQARKVGKVAERLVEESLDLIDGVVPKSIEFARELEDYGARDYARDIEQNADHGILRFNHYYPGPFRPIIGERHLDKGDFTPHLYESHPGFQYYSVQDQQWKDLILPEGQSIIAPGVRAQYRTECNVNALWHQVVGTEETAREGRYSAVYFGDSANSKVFDKETFGSQQGMPFGWNHVPFSEYRKYFK